MEPGTIPGPEGCDDVIKIAHVSINEHLSVLPPREEWSGPSDGVRLTKVSARVRVKARYEPG